MWRWAVRAKVVATRSPNGASYCGSRLSTSAFTARSRVMPESMLSPQHTTTVSASPEWTAAAARLTEAAADAPETFTVFEKVGWMPRYSLTATLIRWNGATKLGHGTLPTGVSPTPTMATWPV